MQLTRPVILWMLCFSIGCSREKQATDLPSPEAATSPRPDKKIPADVLHALENAENFELISLEPLDEKSDGERIDNWLILGKTKIQEKDLQSRLIEALKEGAAAPTAIGAKCFEPRHNVRVQYGGKIIDVMICFECSWVYLYADGKSVSSYVTGRSPQRLFDKVLKDAGIPLAKSRPE